MELKFWQRCVVAQFRSRSNYLPIHLSKFYSIEDEDVICPFCDSNEVGDESHYLLNCQFFSAERAAVLHNNVTLDINLYSKIDHFKKCVPFYEYHHEGM